MIFSEKLNNAQNINELKYGTEVDGKIYICEDLWIEKSDYIRRYDLNEAVPFLSYALETFYRPDTLAEKTFTNDQNDDRQLPADIVFAISLLYDDWLQDRGYTGKSKDFMKSKFKLFLQRAIQNARSKAKYQGKLKSSKSIQKKKK